MVEELLLSIDTDGGVSEGISEEAQSKVAEEARQMKEIAQQLTDDKKKNTDLSKFLTFLLREITDEDLIKALYDTFFITFDPKVGTTYLRKNMNTTVVVGLFVPFYPEESRNLGVDKYFMSLIHPFTKGDDAISDNVRTIRIYFKYLQSLSTTYHDNIPIKEENFLVLLLFIIKNYLFSAPDFSVIASSKTPIAELKKMM